MNRPKMNRMVEGLLFTLHNRGITEPKDVVSEFIHWYRQRGLSQALWKSQVWTDLKDLYVQPTLAAAWEAAIPKHLFRSIFIPARR